MRPSALQQLADKGEVSALERRVSERLPASGPIALSLSGTRESIIGQLMDVSAEGFRAVHTGLVMRSGDCVAFHAGAFHGTAQVVWTRSNAIERESGFLISDKRTS